MTVTVRPRVRPPVVAAPLPAGMPVAETAESTSWHRWVVVLGIPFVLGFAFFGLALALGEEWPMVPAFLFGPLPLIAGYIYLSLSEDANTD